jgi:hypothetical protein
MQYQLSGGNMNGQGTIYQSATVCRYVNPFHVATEVSQLGTVVYSTLIISFDSDSEQIAIRPFV